MGRKGQLHTCTHCGTSSFHFITSPGQILPLAFDLMAVGHKQGAFLHKDKHSEKVNKSVFSAEDGKRKALCVQSPHSSLSVAFCCLAKP